jgi:hypothetical protein
MSEPYEGVPGTVVAFGGGGGSGSYVQPPPEASERHPIYKKYAHNESRATQLWFIVCDEGWRSSIVCERMYEHVADWLLAQLGRTPYANSPVR